MRTAWRDYKLMKIHLDFETRSEVDIRKSGAWVYATHPSTEVLCMAYAVGDGEVEIVSKGEMPIFKNRMSNLFVKGSIFVAHYAMFEYYIWHEILVKRFGYPKIPQSQWRCTASKAAVLALPRGLDGAAGALELDFRKDMEGKKVMLKMCKPRKPTKNDKSKWHETPEDYEILESYCKDDVEVERALDIELRDLLPSELNVWFLDQEINRRGIKVDMEAVDSALELIEQYKVEKVAKVVEISDGFLDGVSRRQKVLTWAKGLGVHLPDFTKETVNETLSGEIPDELRKVLEIRQELGKTSTAKYEAFKKATDKDDILCDTLVYHGASTGRWSGKNVQLHNPPRGTISDTDDCIELMKKRDLGVFRMFYPKVMEAISSCIRGMLIAREGHEFFVSDFNAIEVRVLFWLANEYAGLKRYELNQDLYVDMAMRIFDSTDIDDLKRFVGKQTVLGCGFGMGLNGERFVGTCRTHNVTIALDTAKRAVSTYRETYRAIPAYWKTVERAAIEAVLTKKPIKIGRIVWFVDGDFLYVKLPSNRCLAYHKPEIHEMSLTHMGIDSKTNSYVRQTTWGGTLVENVVQATARDLMVNGMFNVEEDDYEVLLTVHDEVMSERETGKGNVEEYDRLLSTTPDWAKGCPIAAKGWKDVRYKKV